MGVGKESRLMLFTEEAGLVKRLALKTELSATLFFVLLNKKEKVFEGGGVKVPWAKKLKMFPFPG
jgi:hypothetical protein